MAGFVTGDIVIVPFPFSSTEGAKRRPALVVASWPFGSSTDYMLSMISCQNIEDPYIFELDPVNDVEGGRLNVKCYLRPTYTYVTGEHRIQRKVCKLKTEVLNRALAILRSIFPDVPPTV